MSKQSDLLNLTDAISVSGTNVGIGTTSPTEGNLVVRNDSGNSKINIKVNDFAGSSYAASLDFSTGGQGANDPQAQIKAVGANNYSANLIFSTQLSGTTNPLVEHMRIDSSGNVLVGTTDTVPSNNGAGGDAGVAISPDGVFRAARSGNVSLDINRMDSDGDIAAFRKNGTTVGSIGNDSNNLYMVFSIGNNIGLAGGGAVGGNIFPTGNNGFVRDNGVDLGYFAGRYKTVYATTGSINTSDRTEKQDIDAMSEAETRVAVACKGLMRKFRWKDAVAEKGDDARIHFGIIAQDLQDAFAAEGLDAGRYAMFCSNTWWETQTHVPAVEAVVEVLDEEGNVVTGAVEAKETYIRTDHYDTLEKAPEGATERTRLGVRYSELLAFIIGAL